MFIRPVTVVDVDTIVDLKKAVWPKESADRFLISAALQTPSHQTFLAMAGGEPAGFTSCFLTQSRSGQWRWEVDLLAVHPTFRQQGVGSKLVAHTVTAGSATIAQQSRALIQINNTGSQKCFAKHGYQSDKTVYTLYVSAQSAQKQQGKPLDSHFVQVNTFNYRGIWLEGVLSDGAFSAVKIARQQKKLDLVGAIIPDKQQLAQQAAVSHQFEPVAQFHWWARLF